MALLSGDEESHKKKNSTSSETSSVTADKVHKTGQAMPSDSGVYCYE
jgi:hypothetical protein